MKHLILITLVVSGFVNVYAQGRLGFRNVGGAKINNADGTPLEGDRFIAQLWAGKNPGTLSSLANAKASFLTGNGAGYFVGPSVTIPGVGINETGYFQIRAWDTTTGDEWNSAWIRGKSDVFPFELSSVQFGVPNSLAGADYNSFSLKIIPEPSPFPLAFLGIMAIVLRNLARGRGWGKS